MVLKRSIFEIQKQRNKIFKDPSYGYGVIHENIPKLLFTARVWLWKPGPTLVPELLCNILLHLWGKL